MEKSAQELFLEIDRHICGDEKPSQFFEGLENPVFEKEHPFTMLSCLKKVQQSPKYHPEGSVWNHTLLVLDEAAKRREESSDSRAFLWAALLHDIGKAVTTKIRKGKITAYDHDKAGAKMAREFLREFEEEAFTLKVSALVRWHMQILYAAKDPRFAEFDAMKRETNLRDVALLGLCDRLGRTGADLFLEEQNIKEFLKKVNVMGG